MTIQLKPCPFCGGEADICVDDLFWVFCSDCEATTEERDKEEDAVALWNRRHDA